MNNDQEQNRGEFAQVERTTIQDCAKIIRQRAVTYD